MRDKKILIIRPSSIGDIVMASPLIDALHRAYPGVRLSWLVEPGAWRLLEAHPGLEEVICWPKAAWKQCFRRGRWFALAVRVRRFSTALQARRFDVALDIQGLLRSRLLARLSGAPMRIGFESREPGRFLLTRVISKGPSSKGMSSEYRYLAEKLGADPGSFEPRLGLSRETRERARRLLRQWGIEAPFAVLCPFTTRPQKHWLEERWAAVADALGERYRLPVLILGGNGDREAAGRMVTMADGGVRSLAGRTSIEEAAAVLSRAALVVGVDTGLTHMGVAFRRPMVALFGSTCPYIATPNPAARVLYRSLPCSPCRRSPTCQGRFDCMRILTVDQVLAAVRDLFEGSGKAGEGGANCTVNGQKR